MDIPNEQHFISAKPAIIENQKNQYKENYGAEEMLNSFYKLIFL